MYGKPRLLDISVGDEFGDLICTKVIFKIGVGFRSNGKPVENKYEYEMTCKICNRKKIMLSSTIRIGHGITHKACGKGIKTKDPIFYDRWESMRTRTNNPNYEHANCYSERGINSDEFENFIDFYDSMYASFKEKADEIGANNTSLERIDVNKNYSKENCIWIHKNQQQENQRRTVNFITTFPDGHEEICRNVRKFAREHNLNESSIRSCMNKSGSNSQYKGFKFKRL